LQFSYVIFSNTANETPSVLNVSGVYPAPDSDEEPDMVTPGPSGISKKQSSATISKSRTSQDDSGEEELAFSDGEGEGIDEAELRVEEHTYAVGSKRAR